MNADEQAAVLVFAQRMQAKLDKNMHQGGRPDWLGDHPGALMMRLEDELEELQMVHEAGPVRLSAKEYAEAVANECADVANFAMMIADWYLERAKVL